MPAPALEPYTICILLADVAQGTRLNERLHARFFPHLTTAPDEAEALLGQVVPHVLLLADAWPEETCLRLTELAYMRNPEVLVLYTGRPTRKRLLHTINMEHAWHYLTGRVTDDLLFELICEAVAVYRFRDDQRRQVTHLRETTTLLERKVEQRTRELVALNEELRVVLDHMQLLVMTDDLTGLHNRRAMLDHLEHAVRQARRYQTHLACVYLVIDRVNAMYAERGQEACDTVLREITARMRAHIRDVDVPCRIGGDTFLLILPHTDGLHAQVVAHRLHRVLAETPFPLPAGESLQLTVCLGLASLTTEITTAGALLQAAQDANRKAGALTAYPPIYPQVPVDELPVGVTHGETPRA